MANLVLFEYEDLKKYYSIQISLKTVKFVCYFLQGLLSLSFQTLLL